MLMFWIKLLTPIACHSDTIGVSSRSTIWKLIEALAWQGHARIHAQTIWCWSRRWRHTGSDLKNWPGWGWRSSTTNVTLVGTGWIFGPSITVVSDTIFIAILPFHRVVWKFIFIVWDTITIQIILIGLLCVCHHVNA